MTESTGSSERSRKRVVCAALCASWFKNMATGIDWTGRRAQATRADDDRQSNRPSPTHRFCHSAIFRPITPYKVWFFWVSRHRSIILAKKIGVIENVNWSQKHLGILPSSLWNVFLKFFLQMNPIPMRKKIATKHQFIELLAREEKNKDVFSAIFSFECPFSTPSSAIFHPNTPHNFCCP